jgi:hypothetical protein
VLTFRQFLIEQAEEAEVQSAIIQHGHHKDISSGRYDIQFVLPDGTGIALDNDQVHARSARMVAKKSNMDFCLIDVLRAGIIRAACADMYQCCSAITSEQAQFMYDRAMFIKAPDITVAIADADYAKQYAEQSGGAGPVEIDDTDSKRFDMEQVKPAGIRGWVNNHF